MHGEKLLMWLKELKIALIEKNIDKLDELMDNLPLLDKSDDIKSALYLIAEAKKLVEGLQKSTFHSMQQMQKNIDFLKSTESLQSAGLDIRS